MVTRCRTTGSVQIRASERRSRPARTELSDKSSRVPFAAFAGS